MRWSRRSWQRTFSPEPARPSAGFLLDRFLCLGRPAAAALFDAGCFELFLVGAEGAVDLHVVFGRRTDRVGMLVGILSAADFLGRRPSAAERLGEAALPASD